MKPGILKLIKHGILKLLGYTWCLDGHGWGVIYRLWVTGSECFVDLSSSR